MEVDKIFPLFPYSHKDQIVMKKLLYFLLLFISISCTKSSILESRTEEKDGDDFYAALAKGYNQISIKEQASFDWYDADFFANKGLKALKNERTSPEDPMQREISDRLTLDELMIARKKMLSLIALDENRLNFPLKSARLQVLYDYWVEQAEEDWQETKIARFRREFWETYRSLEANIQLARLALKSDNEPKDYYAIYFPNAKLDNVATGTLNKVIFYLKNISDYDLVIEGKGEKDSKLVKQEIEAVKQYLISNSIPEKFFLKEKIIEPEAGEDKNEARKIIELYVIKKKIP